MPRITLRKFAQALCGLALAAVLVTAAEHIIAVDTARTLLGLKASAEEVAKVRAQLGQDRSFLSRAGGRIMGMAVGDFGTSAAFQQPVSDLVFPALSRTLALIAPSWLIGIFLGWGIGLGVAWKRSAVLRQLLSTGTAVALLPPLAIAALLHYVVNFELGWVIPSRLLATLVLILIPLAMTALTTEETYRDLLTSERYMALRGLGWPTSRILVGEGARRAGVAVVSNLSYVFLYLLSGSIFVEIVFRLPGLGSLLLDAANEMDYSLLFGITGVAVLLFMVLDWLSEVTILYTQPPS
jgi:peptide/nickel transport system permease protein